MIKALENKKYYPWLVISLSAAFLFYKYVLQVSPGIMTSDLMRAFQINGAQLGNLAAVYFYGYLIVQLVAGPLLDKFGVRKITPLAILICALGALGFSQSHDLMSAIAARIFMGMGVGFATVNYMKLAAEYFEPQKFAFVAGLLATAVMLGAVFGETPLVIVLNHIGWRNMLVLVSSLGIIIAGLFFLFVKERPKKISNINNNININHTINIKAILTNAQNWLLMGYAGLAFSPLAVLGGLWGNPFLKAAHHLTLSQASFLLSWVFIGLGIGSPVLGLISDKLGKRRLIMQISIMICLLSLVLIIYDKNLSVLIIGALLFLFGFFTGAFMLGFSLAREMNPIVMIGTVVALINTGSDIVGAITEPLVGKFLDLHWSGQIVNHVHCFSPGDYRTAFIVLPVYLVAGFIVLFFIKEAT